MKAIVENLQAFNSAAFATDHSLQKELILLNIPGKKATRLTADQSMDNMFAVWK